MNPILKNLIRKLGIEIPQVIQGISALISKVDAGDHGCREETTYIDNTGIHHIRFEKIGAKTHSLVTRPPISNRDQKALVKHFIAQRITLPEEIQEMIQAVRSIRKGEAKEFLLLSAEGGLPLAMRIKEDRLVFEQDALGGLMPPGSN